MPDDNIGDLSVDVVADTTGLEDTLRARFKAMAARLALTVKAAVDTTVAQVTLDAWKRRAEALKVGLNAALNTTVAKLDLDEFVAVAGRKAITLSVKLSQASLASITAKLQTLTGLNAITGEFQKFSGAVTEFFNDLPNIGKIVLKFASIISLAGTALGSLLVTVNTLAAAGPGLVAAFVAIPGIFAGVALQAAVLLVAIKNAPPAVKQAIAAYKGLKQEIADDFWSGAKKNVVSFFSSIQDQVKGGFAAISTASGQFFGSFAHSLQATLGGGVITKIFDNIRQSIVAFGGAADPLAGIIANLGLFGTSLLPGISKWLVTITTQFDGWLGTNIANGSLYASLQTLGATIQLVWGGVKGLIGIFSGLGNAAENAGIGNLLSPLQAISNVVNSPGFQRALTTLFTGAAAGASGLLSALTPIGDLIGVLAPTISGFLAAAGSTLGTLFSALAKALSAPVFQVGLTDFFNGILDFIKPLIPLMPLFAEKLGEIGSFAGILLKTLGPVFASLISALVPIFVQILEAVQPLTVALGPVLSKIFEALGPVISAVVTALTPFLNLIVQLLPVLLPVVTSIAGALAPALTQLAPLFTQLVEAALPLITQILNILLPLLGPATSTIIMVLSAVLMGLVKTFQLLDGVFQVIGPGLQIVATIIGAVLQTIYDLFTGNFADIGKIWTDAYNSIQDIVKNAWGGIVGIIQGALEWLVQQFVGFEKGLLQIWLSILAKIREVWGDVISFFKSIPVAIKVVFDGAVGWLVGIGADIVNGLLNGIKGAFSGIRSFFSGAITGLIGFIKGLLGIHSPSTVFAGIGANMGAGLVIGISSMQSAVQDALANLVAGPVAALQANLNVGGPNAVSPLGNAAALAAGAVYNNSAVSSASNTTINNTFPPSEKSDSNAVAQEYVNRVAEQVGFS